MYTADTYLHCSIMVAKRLQVLGRKKREQKEQAKVGGEGLDSVPISYKSGLPS